MEKQKRYLKRVISIKIEDYLAEYITAKFKKNEMHGGIEIPSSNDLYYCLWYHMAKPTDKSRPSDEGNLRIALPCRRSGSPEGPWKDPAYYNYIPQAGVREVEACIRLQFNFELHRALLENEEFGHERRNLDVIYEFIRTYGLKSISSDALLKNYYRYRSRIRAKRSRGYKRKQN